MTKRLPERKRKATERVHHWFVLPPFVPEAQWTLAGGEAVAQPPEQGIKRSRPGRDAGQTLRLSPLPGLAILLLQFQGLRLPPSPLANF